MTSLKSLPMSGTKEKFIKHLNIPTQVYDKMGREVDEVYSWLTSHKEHIKRNGKSQPPYDWSDISEKAKHDAMIHIAQSEDEETAWYWNLGTPTADCPNWVARWFLYHKFRYRDGRSRQSSRKDQANNSTRSSAGLIQATHDNTETLYESSLYKAPASSSYETSQVDVQDMGSYYDPIRDKSCS